MGKKFGWTITARFIDDRIVAAIESCPMIFKNHNWSVVFSCMHMQWCKQDKLSISQIYSYSKMYKKWFHIMISEFLPYIYTVFVGWLGIILYMQVNWVMHLCTETVLFFVLNKSVCYTHSFCVPSWV